MHLQEVADARGSKRRALPERRGLPGEGSEVLAEGCGIEMAHAPGRDALDAREARALGKVVQRFLERHRVDEGWQRAFGDAQLAAHPDGGRKGVVRLDVLLEAAARFAHRGDVLRRRASNLVAVRVVEIHRDHTRGVAAEGGGRGGSTFHDDARRASLGGDAKLRTHGDVRRGGGDASNVSALDTTGRHGVGFWCERDQQDGACLVP
mmetsp:Transcript_10617/g.24888  ORF Transcript_10617/g.24888 Transcript_10617/m.24888 type:complete len:207 (-) Transcript_10617:61-681(-)